MVRQIQVSRRAAEMNYAIREVAVPAAELAKKGRKLCMLNIGDHTPKPTMSGMSATSTIGK